MTRTPEEIKKGLVEGIAVTFWAAKDGDAHDLKDACDVAHTSMKAAMIYIQHLEAERDAAAADVKSLCATNYFSGDFCAYCKHNEPDGQCHHPCQPYSNKWGWEWRGVQKEGFNDAQ